MNKKGEGRISTIVFTVMIAVTMMVLLSSLVVRMAVNNDADHTPEFQQYQTYFSSYNESFINATDVANQIDKSKAAINSTETSWIKNVYNNAYVAWSESIAGRAYNAITTSLKMSAVAFTGLTTAFSSIPMVPRTFITFIFILITLGFAFAFARALWEKRL